MAKEYNFSEADIDWMIGRIKLIDPDNATPKMAITVLEDCYAKYHMMSHDDPEVLDAIFQDVKKKKKLI